MMHLYTFAHDEFKFSLIEILINHGQMGEASWWINHLKLDKELLKNYECGVGKEIEMERLKDKTIEMDHYTLPPDLKPKMVCDDNDFALLLKEARGRSPKRQETFEKHHLGASGLLDVSKPGGTEPQLVNNE